MFVGKTLQGEVDSTEILGRLNIYAPERILRQRNFLQLEPRRAVYGFHDPIRFISARFNEVFHVFDFNISTTAFKRRLQGSLPTLNR